jgi:hypothetical protein
LQENEQQTDSDADSCLSLGVLGDILGPDSDLDAESEFEYSEESDTFVKVEAPVSHAERPVIDAPLLSPFFKRIW